MGGRSGSGMKVMCMGMMMMLFMVVAIIAPHAEGALQCNYVYGELTPCLNYALGNGPVTDQCCNGVRSVYAAAKTTPDRQAVCSCLKQVSSGGGARVNTGNIQNLPGTCGVKLPYAISPNMNCATVR